MILVTGGTGLVGAHLLLSLTKQYENIRAIRREESDLQRVAQIFKYALPISEAEDRFSRIEWMVAHLNDLPAMEAAFLGVDRVYHCAAKVSFDSREYLDLRKTNIEGTANIVNLCIYHRVKKLCFVSSIATLDAGLGEEFITETSSWNQELPHNQYAISKYGAEMEVWRGSQEGVPVVIVNPGVIIGPGIWNSGSGVMFPQVFKGMRYSFPKVTGFVGVNDVVRAILKLMDSEVINEQYVVVAENCSFTDILSSVARSLGKPEPTRNLKPWMIYLGWLYQASFGRLVGSEKRLTKQSSKNLFTKSLYSSRKIQQELDFEFETVDTIISETGKIFRKDLKNGRL